MKKILLPLCLLTLSCATTPPEPAPVSKPVEIKNGVDRDGIRQTFSKHENYIRSCYKKTLSEKPQEKLSGIVVLQFDIDPSGQAKTAKILDKKIPTSRNRTTLHDPKLHSCLLAGVHSWDWPVDPEGRTINVIYPLKFSDKPPANMQKKLDQFQKIRR